jgi:hypothetical protein
MTILKNDSHEKNNFFTFIKFLSTKNSEKEHFKIIVEKNNVKRNITFTYNEPV